MSDAIYKVFVSREVAAQFKELSRRAKTRGQVRQFVRSSKWIMSELERTPLEQGEARYAKEDERERMLFRIASAGPIQVEYAVRDDVKMVFIRRFALRKA